MVQSSFFVPGQAPVAGVRVTDSGGHFGPSLAPERQAGGSVPDEVQPALVTSHQGTIEGPRSQDTPRSGCTAEIASAAGGIARVRKGRAVPCALERWPDGVHPSASASVRSRFV